MVVDTMELITPEQIEEVKNRLVAVYDPVSIYLFGSYVWGSPTVDSDLDLMVVIDKFEPMVTDDGEVQRAAFAGRKALIGLLIPKDIIVLMKDDFDDRSKVEGRLPYIVKNHGKLLYSRT